MAAGQMKPPQVVATDTRRSRGPDTAPRAPMSPGGRQAGWLQGPRCPQVSGPSPRARPVSPLGLTCCAVWAHCPPPGRRAVWPYSAPPTLTRAQAGLRDPLASSPLERPGSLGGCAHTGDPGRGGGFCFCVQAGWVFPEDGARELRREGLSRAGLTHGAPVRLWGAPAVPHAGCVPQGDRHQRC